MDLYTRKIGAQKIHHLYLYIYTILELEIKGIQGFISDTFICELKM